MAQIACGRTVLAGVAPTASPDVRYGHPVLRSLDADCAPPSMAPLVSNAGSTAGATPHRSRDRRQLEELLDFSTF